MHEINIVENNSGWLFSKEAVKGRETLDEQQIEYGRFFREAWIAGAKSHFPDAPERYVKPWEDMDLWEQESACAVYTQVRQFVLLSGGKTTCLGREQKGRFVCLCWIVQIFKHIPNPKPSYIADWDEIPAWQRQTDSDIFEAIEKAVLREVV